MELNRLIQFVLSLRLCRNFQDYFEEGFFKWRTNINNVVCVLTLHLWCCRRGDNLFPKNPDNTMRYDYIDYKDTWKAMEKLVEKGLVKAIGLSNFNSRQIDDVLSVATVKPAVLQVRWIKETNTFPVCP